MSQEIEQDDFQEEKPVIKKVYLYKPQVKGEIRTVFNLTSKLIKKLPEQEQLELMKSKDYEIYLALSRRYKI